MILKIRKLACAVAKAYVDAVAPAAEGWRGGRPWLSSSSRSASRRCRPPGCPGSPSSCARGFLEAARREFVEAKGRRRPLHAAASRAPGRRPGSPARPRGAGLGPVPQGREGRRREVDGRGARLREEERGRRRGPGRGRQGSREARRAAPALRAGRSPGRATAEVLPGLLAGVLRALLFPKRMSWDAWLDDGRGAFPFGRPIRWLVLLLDGEVVPFAIHAAEGGAKGPVVVESGRSDPRPPLPAEGLRRTARRGPLVRRADAAAARALRDPRPGRAHGAHRRGARRRRGATDDHGLRDEWRDLVEYPTVVVGEVPAEFRSLPPEVLETVLVHHQKSISLRDGQAAHRALRGHHERRRSRRVRDRARDGARRRGAPARRVVLPRRGPQSARSPTRVDDLAGVTFHQGLGTLPRQVGADGAARRRDGAARPARGRRARARPRRPRGSPRPTS